MHHGQAYSRWVDRFDKLCKLDFRLDASSLVPDMAADLYLTNGDVPQVKAGVLALRLVIHNNPLQEGIPSLVLLLPCARSGRLPVGSSIKEVVLYHQSPLALSYIDRDR